jgi:hypothetical protein
MSDQLPLGLDVDEGVQSTNDDAQESKASCVQAGYFKDAFVKHFVRRKGVLLVSECTVRSDLLSGCHFALVSLFSAQIMRDHNQHFKICSGPATHRSRDIVQ